MRIMHILGNFGVGGAEMGVVRLINALPKDSTRHFVCSLGPDLSMQELLPHEVPYFKLNRHKPDYSVFIPLYRLLKWTKTDVAHVNNLAPWFDTAVASKLAGCQCLETFHGVEQSIIQFSTFKKTLFRAASALTSGIVSVSDSAAQLLSALTGIDQERIAVVSNGIDTRSFKPTSDMLKTELRKKLKLPSRKILFGCVAGLRSVKNHEGLIIAFAKALKSESGSIFERMAHLILVGNGPLEAYLKELCIMLGVENRVHFMGRCNNVLDFLQAFDVFVMNSRTEGLSYAVLEAMACGLPVIVTNVGANPRLIANGQEGFLVAEGDDRQMADRMKYATEHTGEMVAMGRNARNKVRESYSLEKMIDSYLKIYGDI
jgi:glycosyltransferase involved in cell wall biosynthesis